jgi:hypothetical protein
MPRASPPGPARLAPGTLYCWPDSKSGPPSLPPSRKMKRARAVAARQIGDSLARTENARQLAASARPGSGAGAQMGAQFARLGSPRERVIMVTC